jgi:flagellar protein FlbD
MILLTRLGGAEFVINADHILYLERTPDTTLTLITGARLMVHEPVEAVVARVVSYRRRIMHGPEIIESPPQSGR